MTLASLQLLILFHSFRLGPLRVTSLMYLSFIVKRMIYAFYQLVLTRGTVRQTV